MCLYRSRIKDVLLEAKARIALKIFLIPLKIEACFSYKPFFIFQNVGILIGVCYVYLVSSPDLLSHLLIAYKVKVSQLGHSVCCLDT